MANYTKANLAEDLALFNIFADAPKAQVVAFVEDLLDLIKTKVASDQPVVLAGFGKFEKYTLASGTVKPKFTAFKQFKDQVN